VSRPATSCGHGEIQQRGQPSSSCRAAEPIRFIQHGLDAIERPDGVRGERRAEVDGGSAALRDVVLLLRPIKGGGCSGDHDTAPFNARRYVNCEVHGAWLDPDDLSLLDESSAVALLSNLDRLLDPSRR
jgi:hypothetical protein